MDFYMKLPRSKREFILFLVTLSVISMNIIAPLITCFEMGFSLNSWIHVFPIMPILWPCVIATVLITYKPAEFLTSSGDSSIKSGTSGAILDTARQISDFESANNTGYKSFQAIRDAYSQLSASLTGTGGLVSTVKQKMLLGSLKQAETAAFV